MSGRRGKTILVRDNSTQTRPKKTTVEYQCDSNKNVQHLDDMINDEDFFGNLSISNTNVSVFSKNFFGKFWFSKSKKIAEKCY